MYIDPQLATVGINEPSAETRHRLRVAKLPMTASRGAGMSETRVS